MLSDPRSFYISGDVGRGPERILVGRAARSQRKTCGMENGPVLTSVVQSRPVGAQQLVRVLHIIQQVDQLSHERRGWATVRGTDRNSTRRGFPPPSRGVPSGDS